MIDWGLGRYEDTAAELEPAARRVVELAAPGAGEAVVDLACGTGNAALLAARAGAQVTGLDMAPRLVEVARNRAAEHRVAATFVVGDVEELPFDDGSFDLALSVFGLVFAPDARRAFEELVRVLRPGGRAFVSAWVPKGAIDAMVGAFVRALPAMPGPARPRFPWHEPEAVAGLAADHGVHVALRDGVLAITDSSPEAYLERQNAAHPMSVAMRPVLERAGAYAGARERALAALRDGNEDPSGFRVSSPYRIIELRKPTA